MMEITYFKWTQVCCSVDNIIQHNLYPKNENEYINALKWKILEKSF